MKQLFFAGSFAIAIFLANGMGSNSRDSQRDTKTGINILSANDTLPKSKKDNLKKKKHWGKDSTQKKDSLREVKDTTGQ